MGKFKDFWDNCINVRNAEMRSFLRYAMVASIVFVILVGFVNKNNIVRWVMAGMEIRRQERQIENYQKGIDDMNDRIRSLTSNKDSLERYARENFYFAAPGDDVYVVEE